MAMLLQLKEEESVSSNQKKAKSKCNPKGTKSGWLKKRSRHLRQWRRRWTQIEQQQYLCTYGGSDTFKHCTEKIDIKQAKIYYTINKATQFHIYSEEKNTQFYFQCDSIEQATEWLICLKEINESTQSPTTYNSAQNMTDLDLLSDATVWSNNALIEPGNIEQIVSDTELNQLYMKALSLYQLKHYQQCEMVTKSVLVLHPNHREALKLSEYLMDRQFSKVTDETDANKKAPRRRFETASIINTSRSKRRKNKHKKTFSLFQNKLADQDEKKEEKNKEQHAQQDIHPCRLEFTRFITERIQLNEFYDDLIERFTAAQYDDIRFLKDFDHGILRREIGLKPLHIKCFLRKIDIFMNEVKLFQMWLQQIVTGQKNANQFNNITSDGLTDLFENSGIITFEALYRKIQSQQDLKTVITSDLKLNNTERNKVYDVIWNAMHHIEQKQRSRIHTVSQSYGAVNARILGMDMKDVLDPEGVDNDDYGREGMYEEGHRESVGSNDDDFDEMFVHESVEDKARGSIVISKASQDMDVDVQTPNEQNHGITRGGHEYYDRYNEEVWKRKNNNQFTLYI